MIRFLIMPFCGILESVVKITESLKTASLKLKLSSLWSCLFAEGMVDDIKI